MGAVIAMRRRNYFLLDFVLAAVFLILAGLFYAHFGDVLIAVPILIVMMGVIIGRIVLSRRA